jgi:opacity protein-like surface antigen
MECSLTVCRWAPPSAPNSRISARRGFASNAWGRFLPYLTVGFTYATTQTYYSVATPALFTTGSITETRTGVFPHVGAFGIGLEYAIDQHFTVKTEYF